MSESEVGALNVRISADTKGLEKGLDGVSDELKKADRQAKKSSKSFDKLSKTAKKTATPLMAVGAAILSAGVALTAFTVASARARKEVEILARQANTSVEGFESLAFAAKTFGVEAEQVADISKDISDRLGEFATAGTGTFQDFLDVTKKTKQEGRDLANEWQNLSSEEVIGSVVKELEAVNASGAQTTFVMESLGNDLSKLSPLFADNSKQLNILTGRYDKLTQSLALTEGEAEDLRLVSESFDELALSSGKAATKLAAELAPAITDILDGITERIPAATKTIVDFIDSFGTDSKVIKVGEQIVFLKNQIKELGIEKAKLGRSNSIAENSILGVFTSEDQIAEDKARIQEIIDQVEIYKAQLESLWDKPRNQPLFTPTVLLPEEEKKKDSTGFSLTDEQQAALDVKKTFLDQETAMIIFAEAQRQEIESGAMSQSQAMFEESNLRELLAVQAQQEELIALYGEGNARELELWQSLEDQKNAISETGANERVDIAKKEASLLIQTQLSAGASLIGSLASVASKSFKTQKAFAIAQGTLGVAGAMIKALDSPLGFPANLGLVAAVAAQGASLIGAIKSSKPGGGATPSSTGGSRAAASSQAASSGGGQQNNTPESRNISINLSGGGLMSTDQVRELIGQINEQTGDGVQLITNGA